MRELKFHAWDKKTKQMVDVVAIVYSDFQVEAGCDDALGDPDVDAGVWIKVCLEVEHRDFKDVKLMQFTGLKDKNGDAYIYEGDVINKEGNVIVNKYENEEILKEKTNLIIKGIDEKDWWATYKEAMERGCYHAE